MIKMFFYLQVNAAFAPTQNSISKAVVQQFFYLNVKQILFLSNSNPRSHSSPALFRPWTTDVYELR